MNARVLGPGDEGRLESFLVAHADSSMFLRANARRAGLVDHGQPFHALYIGAFSGDRVVGVAAHGWNDLLLLQAPEHAAELAVAYAERSGRPVKGLAGPAEQVRAARASLNLEESETALDGNERLYALSLDHLVIPRAFATGEIVCRAPRPEERDTLCAWRVAYDIELLGATDSAETRERSSAFLDEQIASGNAWVALEAGQPVSLSAFNATLPDMVQLGGIYTPPARRGRGLAKVVVAASLLAARERGASRAILFTNNPSAMRTYEALGFQHVGEYSLVLFRE